MANDQSFGILNQWMRDGKSVQHETETENHLGVDWNAGEVKSPTLVKAIGDEAIQGWRVVCIAPDGAFYLVVLEQSAHDAAWAVPETT